MNCRGCGQRFDLRETIYWTIPPGIPSRPGTSLAVVGFILIVTAVRTWWISASLTWLLLMAAVTSLIWVWHYVFYWWLERNPYDQSAPGTCPHCKVRNIVWPWSM